MRRIVFLFFLFAACYLLPSAASAQVDTLRSGPALPTDCIPERNNVFLKVGDGWYRCTSRADWTAISPSEIVPTITLENSANKSTNTSLGASDTLYPTQKAVKTYADGLVVGLLNDRGSYDASGNVFPSSGGSGAAGAIRKGDLWYISVAGTLGGTAAGVGYSVRALADAPGQTAGNWGVLNVGLGYVPENSTNKRTSFQATPDDTHYPSEKLVKDQLNLKANTSSLAPIATSGSASDLLAGTLPDGRLSANVPLLNTANIFPLKQTAPFLDKGGAVYNAKAYTVADGIANDQTALQALIDAVDGTGATIDLADGEYLVTGLTITNGFLGLRGNDAGKAGARLITASNAPILKINGGSVTVDGIAFQGSNDVTKTLQDAIFIDDVSDIYLRNLFINDVYNGIHLKNTVFWTFLDNVRFFTAKNRFIWGEGTSPSGYAIQINNSQMTVNSVTNAMWFDNYGSVLIDSLLMSPANVTSDAIVFNSAAAGQGFIQISNSALEGSVLASTLKINATITGSGAVLINNTGIYGGNVAAGASAVELGGNNSIRMSFDGGFIHGPYRGVHLAANTNIKDVSFTGVKWNTTGVPVWGSAGATAWYWTFSDNQFFGATPFADFSALTAANVKYLSFVGGHLGENATPVSLPAGADQWTQVVAGYDYRLDGTGSNLFANAINAKGHLLLTTDNTFDIGASGATRPRTGYFGTSLVSPLFNGLAITNNGTNTLNIAAGKTVTFSNSLTFTGTDSSSVALGGGGTVAYAANKLSAFAATTSAELAGVLSNETGNGQVVYSSEPTFNGTGNGLALTVNGPSAGAPGFINFNNNSVFEAAIGVATAANQGVTGSAVNDLVLRALGDIWFGPGASTFKLSAAGVVTLNTTNYASCTGLTTNGSAVVGCTVSTAKHKENFADFSDGLQAIRSITPQTFSWKPDAFAADGGRRHLGLIAEDLAAANPLLVSRQGNGDLQPEPFALHAIEIDAIKKLDARVTALEKREKQK